jgi:solute:Na+ symporter, SSS family
LVAAAARTQGIRAEVKGLISRALPGAETKDADYVFLGFVLRYLPAGLIGLLLAVIFCAAMSSTSSELQALGTTSTLDLYRRMRGKPGTPEGDVRVSKVFTVLWGLVAVSFASFAALIDNLIEAVNILGSIFYGSVLGIFVVAFFVKRIGARAVLTGAIVAQSVVLGLFFASDIGFLWYNVIGCAVVVAVASVVQALTPQPT